MRNHVLPAFLFAGLMAASLPAKAELVTYEFTAVVTSLSGGLLPGMSPGSAITGSFTLDDATPMFSQTPQAANYRYAVTSMEVQLGSDYTFALAGAPGAYGRVSVIDYATGDFAVEGASAAVHTAYGDTFTLNGTELTAGFADLSFADIDSVLDDDNAITSRDFPDFSALSLGDFDGTFSFSGALGTPSFLGRSQLTSLTRLGGGGGVAAVPELDPASASSAVALVAGAASTLRTRRRRA